MAARIVPEGGWESRLKPFRTPRVRNEAYLRLIRSEPCCLCFSIGNVEAAHIRTGSIEHGKDTTGMGRKPDDVWCLPLCNSHHREQHSDGDELAFWARYGRDPFKLAIEYQERFGCRPTIGVNL